jgi:hypothetical protein
MCKLQTEIAFFRKLLDTGLMENIKSISFSREGHLHLVSSNGNSSQDSIFKLDSFGKLDSVLIEAELKWISDLAVLNNGVVLIRLKKFKACGLHA